MKMKKEKAIIVDLDSTLYNIDHRLKYILEDPKKKDWKEFFSRIPEDSLNQWCQALVLGYAAQEYAIIVLTGRNVETMIDTQKQLAKDGIPVHKLYMRHMKDRRPDYEYKEESIRAILEDYDVKMAIDDRPAIIEVYKSLGVQALHVANGYEVWQ